MQASGSAATGKKENKSMASLKLPKGVTYLRVHHAVVAMELLDEAGFGQSRRRSLPEKLEHG